MRGDWRSLARESFAVQAVAADRRGELNTEAGFEVRQRSAELVRGVDFSALAPEELPLWGDLGDVAWKALTKEEQSRIRDQVLSRKDDWAGRPYEQVRGKVVLLIEARRPFEAYEEARRWIAAGGTLEQIQDSLRGADDLKHPLAPVAIKIAYGGAEPVYGGFQVTWRGRVVAPRNGKYRFSVSPININGMHGKARVSKAMHVYVGGRQVVKALPEDWVHAGSEVQLTANQPVELLVELDIQTEVTELPRGALHALLFWEGPGLERVVVAKQYLRLPESDVAGLEGTYHWKTKDGVERRVTQVDPQIDFAWPLGVLLVTSRNVGPGREMLSASRVRWNESLSESRLDEIESEGRVHPLLLDPDNTAGMLTTAERRQFLQILLDRPGLLAPLEPLPFVRIYRAYRLGAEDLALEVFGKWAALHATVPSAMPDHVDIYTHDVERRNACYRMGACIMHEQPEAARVLQDQYLDLPGGGCALPVAYALSYGYKSAGQMTPWLEYLDARLADDSLDGDARVTWLLARAHAEEIRHGREGRYVVAVERITAGQGWIDEARLVAKSPEFKLLGANESAARLAALGKFDAARDMLNKAATGASTPLVMQWLKDVDAYERQMAAHHAELQAAAKQSYRQALQRRRQRAAQQGDQQAVGRYDSLLEASSQR